MIRAYLPNNYDSEALIALDNFFVGLLRAGEYAEIASPQDVRPCDVAVVFGWNKPYHFKIAGQAKRVLVLNYGLLNRPDYWVAGWGNISNHAEFYNYGSPADRWENLNLEIKPWRKGGEHVLVNCQVPSDGSVQHIDIVEWARSIVTRLKDYTEREIIFRPHPLAREATPDIPGAVRSERTLEEDLENAWAIVTYNSTSSAMAALGGVPIFAMDVGSLAWPIARHDVCYIEQPIYPRREQWAYNLAYCQWTLEEFSNGIAWEHLQQGAPWNQ